MYFKKYKFYSKAVILLENIPLKKINSFKRSKWKNVQKLLKKRKLQNQRYIDFSVLKVKLGSWHKIKNSYKTGLFLKNSLLNFFNYSLNIKYFKSILLSSKKMSILDFLVKPFFQVDIFLYSLGFFSSTKEIKHFLKTDNVFLNNKKITKNIFLKKGDILKINKSSFLINSNSIFKNFFNSFCEIDFYTNNIVILKDYHAITKQEISFLFKESLDLNSFIYYLLKK